ncbi:MAG: SgcJ/EcaC family oxidoreductase [Gemmatimonadota bacterium]|nr:SgcJ/EcaC family oxidoreductase [Gemmatimonadota bacterium]
MRMDRTLVLAMFLASGLSACAAKGPPAFTDADGTAIRAVIDSFTTAVKAGDYATAASYYAEDAVFMPQNAPAVEGRAGIQKAFESFGRVSAFSQPVVEVEGVGDLAYARLNVDLTFTPPNTTTPMTDKDKVLIIMRKQADGKWRTTRGMVNSNLPLPGPSQPKR